MRSQSFTTATIALLALGFLAGCASSSDNTALREPGFRASTIRRPALLVRVSVPDDLSPRERARIPEDYQAALVEGLDRLGILAVDVAVAPYNIDTLWGRIIELAPDAQRARLLRSLSDIKSAAGWGTIWSQAVNAGRVIRGTFLSRSPN